MIACVLEVLSDGFGIFKIPTKQIICHGPDDIYVSPNQILKNALRTEIRFLVQ